MTYDDENAGGLMTTSFLSVNQSMTVEAATEYIRSFSYTDLDDVSSVLVVDDNEFLVGIFNITRLVTAPLGDFVSSIIFPSIFFTILFFPWGFELRLRFFQILR